jgi:hypothetical protein
VLNFGFVKLAVVIERSGDGRKNALKLKHKRPMRAGVRPAPGGKTTSQR